MTHPIYQAIYDARTRESKLKPQAEKTLHFKKNDADSVSFPQILKALVEVYNDLSGLNLSCELINAKGENKNDEVFVIGNANGQGLYFDIKESKRVDAESDDPADYYYYRFTTVGLKNVIMQGCVAWLDDYTFKVHGVLNHVDVTLKALDANPDFAAWQNALSSAFQKMGYTL